MRFVRKIAMTIAVGAFAWMAASPVNAAVTGVKFSALCQQEFGTNPNTGVPWLPELYGMWDGCFGFLNKMTSVGSRVFYWGTYNGEMHALESWTGSWEDSVESNDILYVGTHGGAWSNLGGDFAGYASGDETYTHAQTPQNGGMRLGDEGQQLKVLAAWACAQAAPFAGAMGTTITTNGWSATYDHDVFEGFGPRWTQAFRGGLKMFAGSWNTMFIGSPSNPAMISNVGINFAKGMTAGKTILNAWRDAAFSGTTANDPAGIVSGSNDSDCWNRMGMTLSTFRTVPRLQDNQVGSLCWIGWIQ